MNQKKFGRAILYNQLSRYYLCLWKNLLILCEKWTNFFHLLADVNSHNKVVVCYVAGWSAYRPAKGEFVVNSIDPMLCTHIIYAYAGLDNVTHSIHSRDTFLDTEEGRCNMHNIQWWPSFFLNILIGCFVFIYSPVQESHKFQAKVSKT